MQQPGPQRNVAATWTDVSQAGTVEELAAVLRQLRRRDARVRDGRQVTYRELAARTGWSLGIIAEYLQGRILPPTDRFDALVRLLGATPAEQGALATARDRVEESRRRPAPAGPAISAAPVTPPRQLPPDVLRFAGRRAELAELDGLLRRTADSAAVVAVCGTAGVGKTALAVHWAHQVADRFPDGQLYLDLRGFGPGRTGMTPAEGLRQLLDGLSDAPRRLPGTVESLAALYRSLLAGRRILIVLDNADGAEQVRPLLPGTAGCLTVVTSRSRLRGLATAVACRTIPLDRPTMVEAREMLAARVTDGRLTAEPAATDEIIRLSARLPLALAGVSVRAANRPRFSLRSLADQLRATRGGLEAFADDDPTVDVRAVFSWSYDALPPDAARMFRLLALHPAGGIAVPAAASLAGTEPARAHRLLGKLADAHLITEDVPGRFTWHRLLRSYATELLDRVETVADRQGAARRFLGHYLHTAHAAALLLDPHRTPLPLAPPEPGCRPETLPGYGAALNWFGAERAVLVAGVRLAAQVGLEPYAWRLAWTLTTYLDRQGRWEELVDVQGVALAATTRLADPAGQARAEGGLGRAYAMLGRYPEAHRHLQAALRRFRRLDEPTGLSCVHIDLAALLELQGRPAEALEHARRALLLYRAADHGTGRARAMNAVGRLRCLLGDPVGALVHSQNALDLQRAIGDGRGQSITWDSLGSTELRLGRHRIAARSFEHAAELSHRLGDRYYEASALARLSGALAATGDHVPAQRLRRRAADLRADLRPPAHPAGAWPPTDRRNDRPGAAHGRP